MDNQFKYQHSQILQFVYEATKEGKLHQTEKIKIKGIIILISNFSKFLIRINFFTKSTNSEILRKFRKNKKF
jgi:hypothetical protein